MKPRFRIAALRPAGLAALLLCMQLALPASAASLDDLLNALRTSGSTNASTSRPRGLVGKGHWQHLRSHYEKLRKNDRLPVTVEVVYGHAWKVPPKKIADGRSVIRFDLPRGA